MGHERLEGIIAHGLHVGRPDHDRPDGVSGTVPSHSFGHQELSAGLRAFLGLAGLFVRPGLQAGLHGALHGLDLPLQAAVSRGAQIGVHVLLELREWVRDGLAGRFQTGADLGQTLAGRVVDLEALLVCDRREGFHVALEPSDGDAVAGLVVGRLRHGLPSGDGRYLQVHRLQLGFHDFSQRGGVLSVHGVNGRSVCPRSRARPSGRRALRTAGWHRRCRWWSPAGRARS